MTVSVFSGVRRAVSQNDLIALVPDQLARRVAPVLGLSLHRAPMPIEVARIVMIWHRCTRFLPAHRWMPDTIVEVLATLDQGGTL